MPRSTFQTQPGQHIEVSPRRPDSNGKTIDITTENLEVSILMACSKILPTLKTSKLLFYIHALTTQQVKIQLETNGRKFSKLFKLRVTLLLSIVPIKVSQAETLTRMLSLSGTLPTTPIDFAFSNPSPRTSVSTVRELVTSISFAPMLRKPTL